MKTIDSRPTKLIEVALPLPEINDASSYDKMPGIGPHPKGIHHWWARLPLPVARTIVMEVARRFGYFRRDSEFHKLGYDILFRRQIDFGVTSVNYALAQRLARAEEAQ